MTIRLDGQAPLLLSSTVRDDNAFLSVDLTNVDIEGENQDGIPRGTLHVYRSATAHGRSPKFNGKQVFRIMQAHRYKRHGSNDGHPDTGG